MMPAKRVNLHLPPSCATEIKEDDCKDCKEMGGEMRIKQMSEKEPHLSSLRCSFISSLVFSSQNEVSIFPNIPQEKWICHILLNTVVA